MQEKLAYGCRKSRTFDAGKTGQPMREKRVSRCGKSRDAALVALIYDRHGSGRWVLKGTKARQQRKLLGGLG
jgi:hypothetical protein